MTGARILHMCVGVRDLAHAEKFYREALGLEVLDRYASPEGWHISYLKNDQSEAELELVAWESARQRPWVQDQDIHLAVSVESLEAEHARIATLSPKVDPIVDAIVGQGRRLSRYFFATDLDGNWIEFVERNARFR